jgi:hypothetical protein
MATGMREAAVTHRAGADWPAPQAGRLRDGRLHLQDGPIDLVIGAEGSPAAVEAAYAAAVERFDGLLAGLCTELPALRLPIRPGAACPFRDPIAWRMHEAVQPFAHEIFITPMAAVAGAVAEAVLTAMTAKVKLTKAYVNNGGDIALHLSPGAAFDIGLIDRPDRPSLFGKAHIRAEDGIGGIATSGWRGRSYSLGIADAVTVLAARAADADAAATRIGNAIDLPGHPAIRRIPARDLQPDSDLGSIPVTRAVPALTTAERSQALAAGLIMTERLIASRTIRSAALHLQGETRIVGAPLLALTEPRHA